MKSIKELSFVCILVLTLTADFRTQQVNKDQIIVIGSASIEVPADKIIISVNLSFSDRSDGKKAWELHKQSENKLVKLLKEKEIHDSLISFSLLSISSQNDYSYKRDTVTKVYVTNQVVKIMFNELSKFSSFQLDLIAKGYTTFGADFESSKGLEAMKKAIQKAVEQARMKAEIMALASGRKIKKISKIMDTEETEPKIESYYIQELYKNVMAGTVFRELIEIPQKVVVTKQVKVVFVLQ